MTGNDIVKKVRRLLVEPVATFWQDSELLDLINDGELEFNDQIKVLEGIDTIDVVAGQQIYDLPATMDSESVIFLNSPGTGEDNWYRLRTTSLEKEAQESPNFLSQATDVRGTPVSGFIWDNQLYLDPIPDTSVTGGMKIFFKANPTPLTSLGDTLSTFDTFKDGIVAYVLWQGWLKEQEPANAAIWQGVYLKNIAKGHRWKKKRLLDLRNRLDIDSPIPFSPSGAFTRGFNPFSSL